MIVLIISAVCGLAGLSWIWFTWGHSDYEVTDRS